MVFKKRGFLLGLLVIVFSIIFLLGVVSADVLVEWPLTENSSSVNILDGVNASNLTAVGVNVNFSNTLGAWSNKWSEEEINFSKYFEISLTSKNKSEINISSINFIYSSSSTGPNNTLVKWSKGEFNVSNNTLVEINEINEINETPQLYFNKTNISLEDGEVILFRWFPYDTSSWQGTFRLKDIKIEGSIKPMEPKITNPSDKISLEFIDKPSGFFTLNISEENETDKDLSGFISAGNFFKVNSTLINGDFNLTLTFDYDNSVANDNEINVYFYNESDGDWQLIPDPMINETTEKISVTVDHFTLFTVLAEESKTSEESEAKTSRGSGGFCVTEWDCTEWSECLNETQTRTCSYPENWCPPREDKPEETQNCTVVETEEETPEDISIKEKGFLSVITGAAIGTLGTAEGSFFISLIILLVAVVALISFDKSQRKSEKEKSK